MENLNQLEYKIRKSTRARRMRITVYRDGGVVATVPNNFDNNLLVKFITDKKDWILKKVKNFLASPLKNLKSSSKRDFHKYKFEAKVLVQNRIEFFNQTYGLNYNRISIKNQKTRWGSCSRRGNLSFNYRILFLSEEMRDYIVVHELCHLKEFNHSKDFWNLVKIAIPNHKEIRRGLKLK